jgi:hypothetical protein
VQLLWCLESSGRDDWRSFSAAFLLLSLSLSFSISVSLYFCLLGFAIRDLHSNQYWLIHRA